MNTTSNIAAMQTSGVSSTPKGQSSGGSPQGLLGFLEAFIQQMQHGGSTAAAAQNATPGLNTLAEKIAALLKKDGVSSSDIQNMSPQDLAAKIQTILQQQNVNIPASLQNVSSADLSTQLVTQLQQDKNPKADLAGNLASAQSDNLQSLQGQTKEDIAKKLSTDLEQQQQQGVAASPAQLQQLKTDFTQLQAAPGTVDPATMTQLTSDVSSFLSSQGVSQTNITSFLADLTQTLQQQKDQASATDTSTTAAATAAAMAVQPQQQPQQTNANSNSGSSSTASQISDATTQASQTSQNFSSRSLLPQDDKTQSLGGKEAPLGTDTKPSQLSSEIAQQQSQAPAPQPGNLTAKITGFSVNPALINDLANGGSSSSGFSGGFSGQGGNAQQSQDTTGANTLLQPMTADMLQTQNFTNYMSNAVSSTTAAGLPSQTTQQVAIQIQNNASSGVNTMMLQLEPAELGKMNVKLSFGKDGTVRAHMTVDKPETLALLQKDSSHLQKALQQSGLTTDENSLSFDLKQQNPQQNFSGFNGNGGTSDEFNSHLDGNVGNALQAQLAIQSSGYITQSGVNIMV